MTDDAIRLIRKKKLYELIITWFNGRHCSVRTLRFWADPCEYREEALRLFLISFGLSNTNADSAREQWLHGNGQIVLPFDKNVFYEIEYLDEVAPVVICMNGSTIVAVTQSGEDIPYDIEQIP